MNQPRTHYPKYSLSLKLCLTMFPVCHNLGWVSLWRSRIERRRHHINRLLPLGEFDFCGPPLAEKAVHETPKEGDPGDRTSDSNACYCGRRKPR